MSRTLLLDEAVPLLTLTGPGGVGKTRLALAVAGDVVGAFTDGAIFVDVAPLSGLDLLQSAIAQALGVAEAGDQPLAERLLSALRRRHLLIILDNCEHLVAAVSACVAALLATCPSLQVLATSRAPLHLRTEHELPVLPLPVPPEETHCSLDDLFETASVRLFVERARAVLPSFDIDETNAAAIATICRRLDGLPLAIELAAARIKVLSPNTLLAHLTDRLSILSDGPRDAPSRQQTIAATIAWSYDLLAPQHQALFRQLAVFAGGFTFDAAQAVAGERGGCASDVVRDLTALVDQSLVQRVEGSGELRFTLLETVRAFGLEQLVQCGEDAATRNRHAAYYLAFAEQGYPNHFGPFTDIDHRLQQLEAEQPNLRGALAYLANIGDAQGVLRLAGSLAVFWQLRGHQRVGGQWLEWALAQTAEAQTDARCRALVGLGLLRLAQGEREQSAALVRASLAIAELIGDTEIAAHAIHVLGLVAEAQQRWEDAGLLFAQALDRWRALGAQAEEAVTLMLLSGVAYSLGDYDLCANQAEASLAHCRAIGHASGAALALCRLARLARDRGDNYGAALAYHEALQLWSSLRDHWYIMLALAGLAELASATGESPSAATLAGSIDTVVQEAGGPLLFSARINYDRATGAARAALGAERFAELHAAGRQLLLAEAVAIAAAVHVPTMSTGVLTAREHEVLRLIAQARTDQEIADALFLSRRTVNAHVVHILAKLDVRSRQQAAIRALELGLLPGPDEPVGYT
jgi:predicted ATPase/DNA-binding CsgD family transcriptional regulator